MVRTRLFYLAAAAVTVALGLLVHFHGGVLGAVARDMAGDALWAAMIVWLAGAIEPTGTLVARGTAAYAFCVTIEILQLLHTPFLDALRSTLVGHLVLGSGFDPRDLVSYGLGVIGAVSVETMVRRMFNRIPSRRDL